MDNLKTTCAEIQALNKEPISPYERGKRREALLARGLRELAASQGIKLKEPLHINSLGEFLLAIESPQFDPANRQGFGDILARLLTEHKARTGCPGPNTLCPENRWAMINHFAAAQMLETAAKTL
jgi:hypothetical protein